MTHVAFIVTEIAANVLVGSLIIRLHSSSVLISAR
jgi:hypothetical protein